MRSLDNVLAFATAADSAPAEAKLVWVVPGPALSIPIVIFGGSIVLKLIERFPAIGKSQSTAAIGGYDAIYPSSQIAKSKREKQQ